VLAFSGFEAEEEAHKIPGVVSVFAKSAIKSDEAMAPEPLAGVREN
jgi:hypothetical protein